MKGRSPQTRYFATREDLWPAIERIESLWKLRYALCDLYWANEPKLYGSLRLVEDLGVSATGDAARSPAYLVVPDSQAIHLRTIPQRKGGVRYSLSQAGNPQSIVFHPGGLYLSDCLVVGSVGTVSDDARAIALYRDFTRELTRGFEQIRMYRVGPAAVRMLDHGARLVTMGVREPAAYDLRR